MSVEYMVHLVAPEKIHIQTRNDQLFARQEELRCLWLHSHLCSRHSRWMEGTRMIHWRRENRPISWGNLLGREHQIVRRCVIGCSMGISWVHGQAPVEDLHKRRFHFEMWFQHRDSGSSEMGTGTVIKSWLTFIKQRNNTRKSTTWLLLVLFEVLVPRACGMAMAERARAKTA